MYLVATGFSFVTLYCFTRLANSGFTLIFDAMKSKASLSQARKLITSTLQAPSEFWGTRVHLSCSESAEPIAGTNPLAFLEVDEAALGVALQPKAITTKKAVLIPIRTLSQRHRRQIARHMLALSEPDRYLRFGYFASDAHIQRYVDGLNFARDEVFEVFNRRLQLIAMAHLAFSHHSSALRSAEFGVSVSAQARGQGLGAQLFERAVLHARSKNIDLIFIHALNENEAMLKIVRRAGAAVENSGGEMQAYLRLPPQDMGKRIESAFRDAVEDGIGEVDFRLKQRTLQLWQLLTSLQSTDQGVSHHGNGVEL